MSLDHLFYKTLLDKFTQNNTFFRDFDFYVSFIEKKVKRGRRVYRRLVVLINLVNYNGWSTVRHGYDRVGRELAYCYPIVEIHLDVENLVYKVDVESGVEVLEHAFLSSSEDYLTRSFHEVLYDAFMKICNINIHMEIYRQFLKLKTRMTGRRFEASQVIDFIKNLKDTLQAIIKVTKALI